MKTQYFPEMELLLQISDYQYFKQVLDCCCIAPSISFIQMAYIKPLKTATKNNLAYFVMVKNIGS